MKESNFISLDERREVAARLRWYGRMNYLGSVASKHALLDAVGFEGDIAWQAIYNRLADLIEPEERTCRNIAEPDEEFDRPFTCSECGARGPYGNGTYHLGGCEETDGRMCFWDSWPVWRFCPNCGAKVVEQ